ncbi:MAG: hypothetical protein ABIJ00_16160, partial [Candidatus Eisenbacteria bacterium]
DIEMGDENDPFGLTIYGYLRANVEQVFAIPSVGSSGETQKNSDPMEWADPAVHLYGKSRLTDNIDILFILHGNGEGIRVGSAWGNLRVADELQFKVGTQYRRFGLFNEKLDELPAFVGIEPPELFDNDHLMLPRLTMFTIHGTTEIGNGSLLYSLDTDNGEGGAQHGVHPFGADIRYKTDVLIVGLSGYLSTLGDGRTESTVAVGDGSPRGGVMPWMSGDKYHVFGGFIETTWRRFILQTAYWMGDHNAKRDPDDVLTVVRNAGISTLQRERFLGANASKADSMLTADDVDVDVEYTARTAYFRLGYVIPTRLGSVIPYAHWDWMYHPESIQSKTYGGDNETGFADDGEFTKYSAGVVYKPASGVAIKIDASQHSQKFNGEMEAYPEIRVDFSYSFKM